MNDRQRHAIRVRLIRARLVEVGIVPPTAPVGSGHRTPVSEDDPYRSWRPHERCPDHAMNLVLDVLIDRGRSYQTDLVDDVAAELEIKRGTAAAYVSGALLAFREIGWVRLVEIDGRRPVWEVTG